MPDNQETFLNAVKQGDISTLARLLEEDPRLALSEDANGVSAVMLAVYFGKPDVLLLLRRYRPQLTLWEACATGDLAEVERNLAAQTSGVNEYSVDGWTPLHLAAFFGHETLIPVLLEHGAVLDLTSRNGMEVTPLQSALASRQEACARRLIERGADVNGGASRSWPPLVYCAANGLPGLAALLLARGANRNARTPDGRTALQVAEEKGQSEIVELLRQSAAVG